MPNVPFRMLMVADATGSSGVFGRALRPAANCAVDNFISKAPSCEHLRPRICASTFRPEGYAGAQRTIACLTLIQAARP
ncbi:MAG: hypothetical protein ACOH2I_15905 [Pseudomonas sp.]